MASQLYIQGYTAGLYDRPCERTHPDYVEGYRAGQRARAQRKNR